MTCLTVSNYIGLHIKENKMCDWLSIPGRMPVTTKLLNIPRAKSNFTAYN